MAGNPRQPQLRSSHLTHKAARGNVLFYLEYAPGKSPGEPSGNVPIYALNRKHGLHRTQESGNQPGSALEHSPLEGDSPPFVKRWERGLYDLVSLASILVGSPEDRSESRGHRIEHRRRATPWRGGSGSGNAEAVRVEASAVTQHGTGDVEEPIGHRTQGARMTVAAGA